MVSLASQKLLTQILKNAKSERNFNMKNYSSNEDMSKFTLKDAERGYFYYLFLFRIRSTGYPMHIASNYGRKFE